MNSKCTVNPQLIIKYDFSHIFTYRLMYHIMSHYDTNSHRVFIDKQDIVERYNTNYKAVCNAVNEMIELELIKPYNGYKNQYTINNKVFTGFKR